MKKTNVVANASGGVVVSQTRFKAVLELDEVTDDFNELARFLGTHADRLVGLGLFGVFLDGAFVVGHGPGPANGALALLDQSGKERVGFIGGLGAIFDGVGGNFFEFVECLEQCGYDIVVRTNFLLAIDSKNRLGVVENLVYHCQAEHAGRALDVVKGTKKNINGIGSSVSGVPGQNE